MREIETIEVQERPRTGKGGARAARRAGLVPAIVYGDKQEPRPIAIEQRALEREVAKGGFTNRLYLLKLGEREQRVLPRDIQFHVVTDRPIHVDFLRLGADARINIDVPVVFLNEEQSQGLRRGGVLNIVRHEVEVYCRADNMPEQIEIDLAGLDIGDSIHISHITLPEGVTPAITDRDFTIATIAAPTVATEEEEAAEGEEAAAAAAAEAGEEAEAEEGEAAEDSAE